MNEKKLAELTKARRASTNKELTQKAQAYILKQAGIDEDGKETNAPPKDQS